MILPMRRKPGKHADKADDHGFYFLIYRRNESVVICFIRVIRVPYFVGICGKSGDVDELPKCGYIK